MTNRWGVLAILFAGRAVMAFQFQAVGALSPLFGEAFAASYADIGLLIGLYLAPGVFLAYPGGALGARIGDRRAVVIGFALMTAGGAIMALVASWEAQIAGRLLAGVGGVLLNVMMTKMVADWFAGREIGTALGLFLNSWPIGVALALVVLPSVAGSGGLALALALSSALCAAGLVMIAGFYRDPPMTGDAPAASAMPGGRRLVAVIAAGGIWGLYNAALAIVFSFGPAILVDRGWSLAEGSGLTSVVLWIAAISVPLGGVLADRTGRRDAVLLVSLALFIGALLFAVGARGGLSATLAFVALGLTSGLPAGPILSLPAGVLPPAMRAAGMGVFFTLHYIMFFIGPPAAGWLADALGRADAAFALAAAFLVASGALLFVFRRIRGLDAGYAPA